jgi:PAS domain S-box-containing protein
VRGLSEKSPALSAEDPSSLHEAHLQRVMNQLERQAGLVAGKAVHCALQSATLTVIQRVCDIISRETIIDDALKDILYIVADLASASMGALYLRTPEGDLMLAARVNGASDEALQAFAATPHLARAPDAGNEPFVVEATEPSVASLLGSSSATSGVAVPLVASNQQLGILFLAFRDHGELDPERMSFARMAGAHIGQAVAVRRAFARAAKAEHRYRTIMENATDGIWVLAPDGTLLDANAQTEKIHRSPRTEMLGRHFSELLPKETVPARLGTFDELRRLGVIRADNVKIARGDGKIGLVDVSAFVGGVGDNEVMIALEHDNTERHLLEEQLHQAQKMEAIGQLTAGIAHDFNNILAVVLGNSHFLLDGLAKDDPNRADAEEIRVAAERAATLTRQLLAFSRRQMLEPTLVDLNATVEGVRKMLRRVIGEDIDLSVTLASHLGTVRADVGQIEQVIMNLVVNARDAMPSGGKLSIETANVELDHEYVASHVTVAPGKYIVLTISDTGCGMSEETKKHLFEPFFTTKESGKGTGLGLSTCYGIVRQSNGHIWVYSEVGHGTVFKVYLPVVDAPPAEARKNVPRVDLRGTETVLVLEDEPQVRTAVCRILRERGYRVLVAGDRHEARRVVTEHAGPIDLVLSDLILPGSTGPEIVRDALGQRTATKVLFMSGYTDHAALRQLSAGADVNLIQKPFAPETLARRVRTVLDG